MRDYLQSVIEQKDTVNEELKSANEEILSSNEELLSTNEELETAKEELQSINEELVTVNEQLQSRNLELTRVSDDMTNLLGSANVPIVAVGVDLRIRKFTPAAGKVLNLLPADVGRPIGELKSVVEVSDLEALITGVIDTVRTEEREVRDRAGHWYMLCIHPYRTLENKIDGAVVVFGDIDEAKHAQMRLKESGEYAQSIVETVREPILILTEDLRVKSANQSFYQTFRVKPEETENLLLYDLGSGQWNIPSLRTLLEDILPGHHTFEEHEVEHHFPVIGHRVMLLNARQVCPRDGASPLILLAFQDVTEHRRAEQLRPSLERFRILTETMPQIIFTAKPNGVVDYFNRPWTEFTGLSSESIENLSWTRFVHPADLEENLHRWQHSIDTGDPFQFEHRFRRSDGVYCWHLTRANALRDADGHVLIWTGSSTDIDDQKRSEDALKEADAHKNQFLAMLAHELRNPLAALDCGLSLVTGGGDKSDRDWALAMAEHQVRLLTRMVNDLLDTSRITRGTFQLKRERVRPAELIERAVDTVRHLNQAQGHHLHVAMAPELPQLEADPARLEQVVCNLLTNAIKFTPPDGRIEVSVGAEGGEPRLDGSRHGDRDSPGFSDARLRSVRATRYIVGARARRTRNRSHAGQNDRRTARRLGRGAERRAEPRLRDRRSTPDRRGRQCQRFRAPVPREWADPRRERCAGAKADPDCRGQPALCPRPPPVAGVRRARGPHLQRWPRGPLAGAGFRSRCDPPRSRAARDGRLRGRSANPRRRIARPSEDRRHLGLCLRRRSAALPGNRRR